MNILGTVLQDDRYGIESAMEAVMELWEKTPKDLRPEMFRRVTVKEQEENSKQCNVLLSGMKKQIKNFPRKVTRQRMWCDRIEKMLFDAMDKDTIFRFGVLPQGAREELLEAVRTFVRHTREFDKTLDLYAMVQAVRNYVIYFMLGLASGGETWYHEGIWGYSLLYPYTDNYLDSERTSAEKRTFNQRLGKRLSGEQVLPGDALEEHVFSLIAVIERAYPRNRFEGLYELLMIVYDAQVGSLLQQDDMRKDEWELCRRSAYKGGASVYVDQYLIKGCMKTEDVRFLTAFGLFLQLADDLQDIEEDHKNGHQTYMTLCAREGRMDEAVGRLLGFLSSLFTDYWIGVPEIRGFLLENCVQVILITVFQNQHHFSSEFMAQLLEWSVLPAEYSARSIKEAEKLMEEFKDDPMEVLDVWVTAPHTWRHE